MNIKKLLKLFEAPVSPGAIASAAQASGLADPNKIKPGQQIKIPMQGGGYVTSTVKKGDTLSGIINRAQTTQGARASVAPKAPAANPNQAAVDASNRVQAAQTAAVAAANAPSSQASMNLDAAKKAAIGGSQPPAADAPYGGSAASAMASKSSSSAPPAMSSREADMQRRMAATRQSAANPSPASPATAPAAQPAMSYAGNQASQSAPVASAEPAPATAPAAQPAMSYAGNQASQSAPVASAEPAPATSTPTKMASAGGFSATGVSGQDFEESVEENNDLEEMIRLSGITISEKAPPTAKGERMVKHIKKGYAKDGKLTKKEKSIAYATAWKQHNKEKISESVMLEAGSNLEHIITRFKHETKKFLNGEDLDEDLYNALYDYYIDNGEMPYVVAKARQGEDPYSWVARHFEDELAMMGHQRQFQETVVPVVDNQLSELARLAGLSEASDKATAPSSKSTPSGNKPQQPAKVSPTDDATKSPAPQKKKDPFDPSNFELTECGDMSMDQDSSLNVSTNMSSDGKKSVTISAQGEEAAALMQMLKLAGMGHVGHGHDDDEPVVMISSDDEEMMEYANDPEEEYHSIDSIMHQGNDLNREKRQYADKPKLGDNPMAESILDFDLNEMLESILIRNEDDQPKIEKDAETGRVRATYAPPKKPKAPDQSELPLQKEPYHGPRSLKVNGEKTGTEKDVDEGSIKPGGLTGTWSADPPKKGQPDVPPPVPMDPVYPAAKGKSPGAPSSPGIPKPGKQK